MDSGSERRGDLGGEGRDWEREGTWSQIAEEAKGLSGLESLGFKGEGVWESGDWVEDWGGRRKVGCDLEAGLTGGRVREKAGVGSVCW